MRWRLSRPRFRCAGDSCHGVAAEAWRDGQMEQDQRGPEQGAVEGRTDMNGRRKLIASFAAVVAVAGIGFTSGGPAHAAGPPSRTLTVGDCTDGTSYPTIQSAIDAANPGDTVNVCPGTYAERVTVSRAVSPWAAAESR